MTIDKTQVRVDALGRLDRKNAALALGKSEQTLANWCVQGAGPAHFKVNGRVYYWLADVEAYGRGEVPHLPQAA